jgi:hypothetical protein
LEDSLNNNNNIQKLLEGLIEAEEEEEEEEEIEGLIGEEEPVGAEAEGNAIMEPVVLDMIVCLSTRLKMI